MTDSTYKAMIFTKEATRLRPELGRNFNSEKKQTKDKQVLATVLQDIGNYTTFSPNISQFHCYTQPTIVSSITYHSQAGGENQSGSVEQQQEVDDELTLEQSFGSFWSNVEFEKPQNFTEFHQYKFKKSYQKLEYIKGDYLCEGSFSSIYSALSFSNNEKLVLKSISLNLFSHEHSVNLLNRVEYEFNLLKSLSHSNIIRYQNIQIEENNRILIFLERLEQGSLKDFLETYGKMKINYAFQFMKEILKGVQYLHQKSIIHRDLKASNILLSSNFAIKITDFDSSFCLDHLYPNDIKDIEVGLDLDMVELSKLRNTFLTFDGSLAWLAPEMLTVDIKEKYSQLGSSGEEGKEEFYEYLKKTEIWSLGCTFLELINGHRPLIDLKNEEDLRDFMMNLTSFDEITDAKHFSGRAELFLRDCLQITNDKRLFVSELLLKYFTTNRSETADKSAEDARNEDW